jgi:hypothetical protein
VQAHFILLQLLGCFPVVMMTDGQVRKLPVADDTPVHSL